MKEKQVSLDNYNRTWTAITLGGSEFENDLLNYLCKELAKSDMQAAQKLLICLVCDRFDDFEGAMEKVRSKLYGQVY